MKRKCVDLTFIGSFAIKLRFIQYKKKVFPFATNTTLYLHREKSI